MNSKGIKIIISGPSGSGKGTIVKELVKSPNIALSISATTRVAREGEEEGVHYFFKEKEEFEQMIKEDRLLEYAEFCGNYYGTPKDFIDDMTNAGKDVILEIEVQGALQVKNSYPEAIFIFVIPPSLKELKERLVGRGTETTEVIEKRLARAKEELLYFKEYDYLVINENVNDAANAILNIINAEHHKIGCYNEIIENIIEER